MSEGDRLHSGARSGRGVRRRRPAVLAALLVLAVVAAGAVWLGGERLGLRPAEPDPEPAAVEAPRALELPGPPEARPVAEQVRPGAVDPDAVRRALRPLTGDPRLGPRVAVAVAGLSGEAAHAQGPPSVTPASTLKILTSVTALSALGPEHTFRTTAVATGRSLVLVGGGDPLLTREPPAGAYPERADLATLARRTARALAAEGRDRVRLSYDASLFTGPPASPGWEDDYLPDDVVSPITALWVDGGREQPGQAPRADDPAAAAAAVFAAALRERGVTVAGPVRPGTAPAQAEELAAVEGAQLAEVVQYLLESSDNETAEVLARHVALATGEDPSVAGAGRAMTAVARELGVPMGGARVEDGSGLARGNRLRVGTLLALLAVAGEPGHPELAAVLPGLPVAGFSGSLTSRFVGAAEPGLGVVRAKTGTLTGVHGLAGVVTGRDGTPMLFVALADRVAVEDTLFTRDRLDRIGAALAACRCGE
jgi:D-alanyl-D-alanine carboxypeptidase/D-alanyl-D-alanine-endopeptidase (penicillin-binding protein 4)